MTDIHVGLIDQKLEDQSRKATDDREQGAALKPQRSLKNGGRSYQILLTMSRRVPVVLPRTEMSTIPRYGSL